MADFSFSDDQELQKLNAQVLEDPDDFEHWEKLVRAAEAQEGGLNRNSSPGAISSTRDVYDSFLARFPLFFGYWKKYADLEFAIAGTEAAEMVYERGIASIGTSVDLWANYCGFKVETSHDPDVIRELFDRGVESVGLDYLAHPFWDKYIEFEERLEAQERVFTILGRIINIPMHQYARYFERYRALAASRPLSEIAPEPLIARFQSELANEGHQNQKDSEADIRAKVDAYHMELFHQTHAETTKRWTFESEIKRPYFHVTELDDAQLANWSKYLDFEESEGDYTRTKFLYERCLVTAANYEEFWMRYARWMLAQPNKTEEVRNIYGRASCIFVPASRPTVRLYYAQFEESIGRPDTAFAILEAILMNMPAHVETIVALANVHRRQHGLSSAVEVLQSYANSPELPVSVKGAVVSEWARMVWKVGGDASGARKIFQEAQKSLPELFEFWANFLGFELQQPTSSEEEDENFTRIKAVFDAVRRSSTLPSSSVRDLSEQYFIYLRERGGKDAMAEFMRLDLEVNGSEQVAKNVVEMEKTTGLGWNWAGNLAPKAGGNDLPKPNALLGTGDHVPPVNGQGG